MTWKINFIMNCYINNYREDDEKRRTRMTVSLNVDLKRY